MFKKLLLTLRVVAAVAVASTLLTGVTGLTDVEPAEAAPTGTRAAAGFGDARVNGYGGGNSWVGSYSLNLRNPDGTTEEIRGFCIDHAINYPRKTVREIGNPLTRLPVEQQGMLSYLLWRYGDTDDRVTAAAMSLLMHDLTDRREGGTSTWRLNVDSMSMGSGFAGNGAAVKARAIALRDEARQLAAPWKIELTDIEPVDADNDRVVGRVLSATGNPVPNVEVEVGEFFLGGGVLPSGATSGADGRFVVTGSRYERIDVRADAPGQFRVAHGGGSSQRVLFGAEALITQSVRASGTQFFFEIRKNTTNPAYQSGSGAVFKVEVDFSGTGNGPFRDAGTITINGDTGLSQRLVVGPAYRLTEVSAPNGQTLAEPFVITPAAGDVVELDVTSSVSPGAQMGVRQTVTNKTTDDGELNVVKLGAEVDDDGNVLSTSPLAGATLEVAYDSNNDGTFETPVATVTSETEPVNLTGLKFGNYQVTETAAPDGWDVNPDPVVVEVAPGSKTPTAAPLAPIDPPDDFEEFDPVARATIINTPTPVPLVPHLVEKRLAVDAPNATNFTVEGAAFDVRPENAPAGSEPLADCVTGPEGLCRFPALFTPDETYCLTETAAPVGMTPDPEPTCFVASDAPAGGETVVFNDPTVVRVEVLKTDALDDTVVVEGAVFELCRTEETDGWTLPAPDPAQVNPACRTVATATTGPDGTAVFEPVPTGVRYCVIERSVPDGWLLDQTEYCFETNETGTVTVPAVSKVEVSQDRDVWQLDVAKTTSNFGLTDEPVAGAVFDVWVNTAAVPAGWFDAMNLTASDPKPAPAGVPAGYELAGQVTTGKDGTFSLGQIPAGGDVCLVETSSPVGWVLNPTPECVSSPTVFGGDAETLSVGNARAGVDLNVCKVPEGAADCETGTLLDGARFYVWLQQTPVSGIGAGLPDGLYPTEAPDVPVYSDAGPVAGQVRAAEAPDGFGLFAGELVADTDPESVEITFPAGHAFCVVEVDAPEGFTLNAEPVCVTEGLVPGVDTDVILPLSYTQRNTPITTTTTSTSTTTVPEPTTTVPETTTTTAPPLTTTVPETTTTLVTTTTTVPDGPVCVYVTQFSGTELFYAPGTPLHRPSTPFIGVNIPAGTAVEIRSAESSDMSADRINQTQTSERFVVEFWNDTELVATSATSTDLADLVVSAFNDDDLGVTVVDSDITRVRVLHVPSEQSADSLRVGEIEWCFPGAEPPVTTVPPATTIPVTTAPASTTTPTTAPDTTVPSTTVTTTPSTSRPVSTTVPETTTSAPETTAPETTVPETTTPETTSSVPETTVPESTVPETTVPAPPTTEMPPLLTTTIITFPGLPPTTRPVLPTTTAAPPFTFPPTTIPSVDLPEPTTTVTEPVPSTTPSTVTTSVTTTTPGQFNTIPELSTVPAPTTTTVVQPDVIGVGNTTTSTTAIITTTPAPTTVEVPAPTTTVLTQTGNECVEYQPGLDGELFYGPGTPAHKPDTGFVNVNIPAGATVNIPAAESSDESPNRTSQNQTSERFKIEFWNDTELVHETDPTGDLDDDTVTATGSFDLGSFTASSDITRVRAVHVPSGDSPDSVNVGRVTLCWPGATAPVTTTPGTVTTIEQGEDANPGAPVVTVPGTTTTTTGSSTSTTEPTSTERAFCEAVSKFRVAYADAETRTPEALLDEAKNIAAIQDDIETARQFNENDSYKEWFNDTWDLYSRLERFLTDNQVDFAGVDQTLSVDEQWSAVGMTGSRYASERVALRRQIGVVGAPFDLADGPDECRDTTPGSTTTTAPTPTTSETTVTTAVSVPEASTTTVVASDTAGVANTTTSTTVASIQTIPDPVSQTAGVDTLPRTGGGAGTLRLVALLLIAAWGAAEMSNQTAHRRRTA